MYSKGKMEFETLLKILLLTAFLLIAVTIVWALFGGPNLSEQTMSDLGCKWTNAMKSEAQAFSLILPRLCVFQDLEEEQTIEDVAKLLKRTWTIYGQGKWSFGNQFDEVEPVYGFYLEKDFSIEDLITYLLTHDDSSLINSQEKSDYNFIQQGGIGQTLCFDPDTFGNSFYSAKFESGVPYFIIFYDDQGFFDEEVGDKILISRNPKFDANSWHNLIYYLKYPSKLGTDEKSCLTIPLQ